MQRGRSVWETAPESHGFVTSNESPEMSLATLPLPSRGNLVRAVVSANDVHVYSRRTTGTKRQCRLR